MDLASVVAALASVGVRVSGSTPNSSVQVDSSRACPPGLAGPEPSGTINDLGQHFHIFPNLRWGMGLQYFPETTSKSHLCTMKNAIFPAWVSAKSFKSKTFVHTAVPNTTDCNGLFRTDRWKSLNANITNG